MSPSRIAVTGGPTGFVGGTVAAGPRREGARRGVPRAARPGSSASRGRPGSSTPLDVVVDGSRRWRTGTPSPTWRSSTTSTASTPTAGPGGTGSWGWTRRVVDAANASGTRVGYVSTDWVFDGTGHLVNRGRAAEPGEHTACSRPPPSSSSSSAPRRASWPGWAASRACTRRRTPDHGRRTSGSATSSLAPRRGAEGSVGGSPCGRTPSINSVATPVVSPEIGALLGRAVDRGRRRHPPLLRRRHRGDPARARARRPATSSVSTPVLLDFRPPPDEARLPAPVPYDTSMSGRGRQWC